MEKPLLLGLSGYKQSGKSTAVNMLKNAYDFIEISWAEPLKEVIGRQLFGLGDEVLYGDSPKREDIIPLWGKSGRQILQEVGTDLFRNFDPDFWVKIGKPNIKKFLNFNNSVAVSDCRFLNEVEAIKEMGGKMIRITKVGGEPVEDMHESERALDDYTDWDFRIVAAIGDLQAIYNQVKAIVNNLREE